ncbi:MAG: M24 family metallopeptidase [Thermoguttaceae bacterium]|jgi:Xaa-Pro aminopeptidase
MSERERARREKLVDVMTNAGLDGYLVVDPVNVSYLTGFKGDDSFLWIGDSGACILSDTRFEEQIAQECPDIGAEIRSSGQSTHELLEVAISNTKYSSVRPVKVGIESQSTTLSLYEALRARFSDLNFIGRESDVERLRSVKDSDEIEAIQRAIDVSIAAYREIKAAVGSDASEIDIRNELEYTMRKFGADDVSFPSIVAFDERAALPHAIPTSVGRLGDAKMVLIDWGAKKEGYVGDLTRSYLTERGQSEAAREYRAKFNEIFQIVLEAHDKAIEAIKPGVPCNEIDSIARDSIRDAGYGDYFGHGLGHGIGRVVHDFGGFSPNATDLLVENMIVTVEPGIYLPGWGGIRIEDDVLVTANGARMMSSELPVDE